MSVKLGNIAMAKLKMVFLVGNFGFLTNTDQNMELMQSLCGSQTDNRQKWWFFIIETIGVE